jgi:hypothetical protein
VKIIFLFIFSFQSFSQTPDQLRDILDPTLFKKYEKMFEKMIDEMGKLDHSQFKDYNGLFEKNLLEQFQNFEKRNQSYKWEENKTEKILKFSGEMIENEQAKIEIKKNVINISASFKEIANKAQSKSASIRFLSLKIKVPKECDESSVRFDNSGKNFKMIFKKLNKKEKMKPLRSPLKKQLGSPTI